MPNFQLKPKELAQKKAEPEIWNFSPVENETKILAFSGKLGSGKTSSSNFLHSLAFMYVLKVTEHAYVSENGKLVVKTAEGDYNEVNLQSKHPEVVDYLTRQVWPFIKNYSCADPLKRIAIDVLGLDEQLVYGSQDDKATPTYLLWENMPSKFSETKLANKKGPMTIREVLEYVGTQIFRKMSPNCWSDALIRTINKENPAFAIIDDVRFANEVEAIQKAGGKVIRLTLTTEEAANNTHISNVELDNFERFDKIIDNQNMPMDDTFRELLQILTEWGFFSVVNQ